MRVFLRVMKLVDVHCHLESMQFNKDLNEVIKRAEDAGVEFVVNSGTSPDRNRETLELSKKYSLIKCAFGWYPVGNLSKDIEKEIKWIEEHEKDCLIIGEIGLDYAEEEREAAADRQKEMFRKMIRLAKKLNKPILIHSRKAELEAIEVLEEEKAENVIMHCFNGNMNLIKRVAQNGWYFSVPAVITRLQHFQTLVGMVDLKQLLTETDAPYLAPVARERSEPANVAVTIREIAKIKKLTEEEVAEQIYNNAKKVLNL
jgi:TatD DNase family protein